ncbi:hypothetical protein [Escherichia phage ZCEC13]|uniref:Uncharacterized protein n=1 Tax=Escherichia phage ZCEC13 TaxID=2935866 RepID=A0AAE9KRQ6_9CAUD|nr:hypothetical protein [Escherichia phage ZCEC13]
MKYPERLSTGCVDTDAMLCDNVLTNEGTLCQSTLQNCKRLKASYATGSGDLLKPVIV